MSYSNDNSEAFNGFDELESLLKEYSQKTDESHISNVLEVGAKEFVSILLKLPKPKSAINKSGYTHMVDCFAYRKRNKQLELGWGKYYGPMAENGTVNMRGQSHLMPAWERNKERIYKTMIERIDL